jgi:hypothetical protein
LKNNRQLLSFCALLITVYTGAQNNTFSPYSRYGLGEITSRTFAHNMGMGGAYIALKPDSTMPIFINAGNPASYALIRLTSLEVGGKYVHSEFKSNTTGLNANTTNFAYAALGFPVGRRGGASFGIMPYSVVGYNMTDKQDGAVGDVTYEFEGSGGLNKAYLGYGIMPFNRRLVKFRYRHLYVPDSMRTLSPASFKVRHFFNKMLSDLSVGVNGNYLFGNALHVARVVYPVELLYNHTYTERSYFLSDVTGNFGAQTAITIDSVRSKGGHRRNLKERVKFTFGYVMSFNNDMKARTNTIAFNYIKNSLGAELVRDTVSFRVDRPTPIALPLEQGFGIGFKKGERLNIVADLAFTFWNTYKAPHESGSLVNSMRTAIGAAWMPEKYAAGRGSFFRKTTYRLGAGYESGYINLGGTNISTYYVTAGVGLPVGIGRLSSVVNISIQAGRTGTTENGLIRENFARIHFGFTFCDRWFQKFRYD